MNTKEPAIYRHAMAVYKALKDESRRKDKVPTFTGHVGKIMKQAGVSNAYYGPVSSFLATTGCVTMTQRGSRSSPSIIVLHHEPKLSDAENWRLTPGAIPATISETDQKLSNILDNIGGIDIKEAFSNLEQRVSALEGKKHGG